MNREDYRKQQEIKQQIEDKPKLKKAGKRGCLTTLLLVALIILIIPPLRNFFIYTAFATGAGAVAFLASIGVVVVWNKND